MNPGTMERAWVQLAGFEHRQEQEKRRSVLPIRTRAEMDALREKYRGLSAKDFRTHVNQFVREGNQSTNNEQKLIRIHKQKGSELKRVSLTNFAKFSKAFTDPSKRGWEQMSREHQNKMAQYVIGTVEKYLTSAQHDIHGGGKRRLRAHEVHERRIPLMQEMLERLEKRIDSDSYVLKRMKKSGLDEVMIRQLEQDVAGMKNRQSIIQNVLKEVKSGNYSNSIKKPSQKNMPKNIPSPAPKKEDQALTNEQVNEAARLKAILRTKELERRRDELRKELEVQKRNLEDVRRGIERRSMKAEAEDLINKGTRPPAPSDATPLFAPPAGVNAWIDNNGKRHQRFTNRRTALSSENPSPEQFRGGNNAANEERPIIPGPSYDYRPARAPTIRERARERWLRIRNGMKRLRERMRRKTKKE